MQQVGAVLGKLTWAFILITSVHSYEWLNRARTPLHVLETPLDARLPFVPLFALPYVFFPFFLLLTLLLFAVMDWQQFTQLALAIIITSLAADFVFVLLPTYVPRPVVAGEDLGSTLVRFVYAHDQPYNAFPSLHTAGAALCEIAYFQWRRRYGLFVLPLVVAIIASTMLIRQHYLVDIAGGVALASSS